MTLDLNNDIYALDNVAASLNMPAWLIEAIAKAPNRDEGKLLVQTYSGLTYNDPEPHVMGLGMAEAMLEWLKQAVDYAKKGHNSTIMDISCQASPAGCPGWFNLMVKGK